MRSGDKKRIFKFCTLPKFENSFLSPCSAVCFTQHLPYPHPLTSHTPVSHQILSIGMSFYRRSRTTVYVCPVRTLFIGQTGDIAQFLRWIAVSMDKLLNIASLSSCVISSRSASHNAFSGTKQSRHPLVHHSAFSCTNHCPRPRWYPIFCTNCCSVSIWYLRNSFPARNANYVQTTVLCSNLIFTL